MILGCYDGRMELELVFDGCSEVVRACARAVGCDERKEADRVCTWTIPVMPKTILSMALCIISNPLLAVGDCVG